MIDTTRFSEGRMIDTTRSKYVRAKVEALAIDWLIAWEICASTPKPREFPTDDPAGSCHERARQHEELGQSMRAEAFLLEALRELREVVLAERKAEEAATELEAAVREERKAEEEQARTEGGR